MADYQMPFGFTYNGMAMSGLLTNAGVLDQLKNLKFNESDVLIATYSKSGTTWMNYIVQLVLAESLPEVSQPQEKKPNLKTENAPFIDFSFRRTFEEHEAALMDRPSPRLFCTHLPRDLLPVTEVKPKVIVVMRNPKDALVSFFNFYRMAKNLGPYKGSWDDFFQMYKEKRLWGGDVFDVNLGWWQLRDQENVLAVTYEDMTKDLPAAIRKVAAFCGKDPTDEELLKMAQLASFSSMKDNPETNHAATAKMGIFDFNISKFIRKGQVGDWKNYFSEEQSQYVDKVAEEYAKQGLVFDYELYQD